MGLLVDMGGPPVGKDACISACPLVSCAQPAGFRNSIGPTPAQNLCSFHCAQPEYKISPFFHFSVKRRACKGVERIGRGEEPTSREAQTAKSRLGWNLGIWLDASLDDNPGPATQFESYNTVAYNDVIGFVWLEAEK